MAAKPKLTPEEWKKVRNTWESDPREGYAWIVDELSIPMTRAALRKVALKEGWVKKSAGVSASINRTMAKNAKVEGKVSKAPVKVLNNSPVSKPAQTASKGNSMKASKPKVSKVSQTAMVSKVSNDDGSDTLNDESETIESDEYQDLGGRPTLYQEDYVEQVYKLCILGATDKDIAEFFNVRESTINNWKIKHPEFLESLRRGKMMADADMAVSLYKRGMGYSHPETHVSNYKGEITLTEIIKHYPPEVGAAFLFLKNRHPDKWKDKIELKEDINLNVFPPKEELDAIYDRALEEARKRNEMLIGRRERIGIVIEHDSGLIDD